jgi:hypothetical protein
MRIVVGILGVALVATVADYTWYTLHVRHSMVTGIIHGAVLLTAVGAVLGLHAGRVVKGLPIGALAGIGGALTYYLLVALVDRRTYGSAIPVVLGCTVADRRGAPWPLAACAATPAMAGDCDPRRARRGSERRRVLHGHEHTVGDVRRASRRNYAVQFGAWAVAWLLWLLALTVGRRSNAPRRP